MTKSLDLASQINTKLKKSFSFIRQDLKEMQVTVDAMRTYLRKKEQQQTAQANQIEKSQKQLEKNIDEFTQKTIQIKLALSQINAIKSEVVIRKDLAKIEDRIKASFKEELASLQEKINTLEKGTTQKRKSWFKRN